MKPDMNLKYFLYLNTTYTIEFNSVDLHMYMA